MRNKINLLIVNPSLYIGGAEVVIKNLCHYLDKDLFNVSVFCLKKIGTVGQELKEQGYDVESVPAFDNNRPDYFTFLKLLDVIKKKKINIIHSHALHPLVDSCLVKLVLRLKSKPISIVHTFHCGLYPDPKRTRDLMERITWRFVDQLVAVGQWQKKELQKVYKIPKNRLMTIWNGVSHVCDNSQLPQKFPYKANGIVIGTIATLYEQKGITYLLDVAHSLKSKNCNVSFIVAGEGPLRSELEEKIEKLGLEDTVQLVGWVENASATLMPFVDIYFQPSLWEAMSIVIIEAMMAGKPIVATDVGENPYVLQNGINGFVTEAGRVDQMVAALEMLLGDTDLRNRLGIAALQSYRQTLTAKNMVKRYQDVYMNVLQEK